MDYDKNLKDNITHNLFNDSAKNVLNWIKDNRDKYDWAKDPNAYEMTNLFLFAAKYRSEGEKIDISCIQELWEIRKNDFQRCNISENNFIYKIIQDAYKSAISCEPLVKDSDSHDALRKMAGIGLNLHQQKRDNDKVIYNNPQELMELLDHSKSLKKSYPDLFEKYLFQSNIDRLCELQLSQTLPKEIQDLIVEHQAQLRDTIKDSDLKFGKEDYLLRKLLRDSEQIFRFIYEMEKNDDITNKSNSPASSYYYSLNFELSHSTLESENSENNLEKAIDSICERYKVRFDNLLNFAEQSKKCLTNMHSEESKKLYDRLQDEALEYFYNKIKENIKGDETR